MKKIILTTLSAVLVFTACVKEIETLEVAAPELYASIEDGNQTKTVLDDNSNIRWSDGDQILAFMKSALGLKYQIKDEYIGKTSGYFSKVTSASSDDLGAGMELDHNVVYYPYGQQVTVEKSGNNYIFDATLPAEQNYACGSFGNGSFPMVAISDDNDISFKNLCGGIKLQFLGTMNIASVKIEGKNNEKLSGAASVTAYTDNETMPSIAMAQTASTSVTLNCGDGIQLNEETITEFIISLPPVIFSKGFTITVTDTDDNEQVVETNLENIVYRSKLLTMPEVALYKPAKEVINLSEEGTANSYIVSESGIYEFYPTKGNSNEPVGTISSVEVLWETFNTNITPSVGDVIKNVEYVGGAVRFETALTFVEGNAVIAAKDDKGTILWSWHIWLTDIPQEQVYFNEAGTMMDRNLGATSATPGELGSLGLLYQWGRKDPFIGLYSSSEDDAAGSTITWPEPVTATEECGTVEYAISNPTTYIGANWSNNNIDWLYIQNNALWRSNKTIYDPCPKGWRVPEGGPNGVWVKAYGNPNTIYIKFDDVNKGFNFSGIFGESETIWYPLCGLYNAGGKLSTSNSFRNWSSSVVLPSNYYSSYELQNYVDGRAEIGQYAYNSRVIGEAVRCVKE